MDDRRGERDYRIDIMRCLGTALVILAHMGAGYYIQNIRTFDVVMLVFISGMSFKMSWNEKKTPIQYLKKRFVKLVIPTYITISIIFVLSYIVCVVLKKSQVFDLKTILYSYVFLNDGIGYIWITRVYIIVAISLLLTQKLLFCTSKHIKIIFVIVLAVISICMSFSYMIYHRNIFLDAYILDVVPYCLVAIIGVCFVSFPKLKIFFVIFFGSIFCIYQIVFIFSGSGFCPDAYKYPANLYYLSYGLAVSCCLWGILPNKKINWINWSSKNSFTIYLFHIFFLFATNIILELEIFSVLNHWYIKYCLVMIASIIACFLFNRIKEIKK